MDDQKAVKAGDPCPVCGGTFAADPSQATAALVDRKKRNAANPAAAARYAELVQAKAAEHGTIHVCGSCGYRTRFQARKKAA